MIKRTSLILIAAIAAATSLAFQNCAEPLPDTAFHDESSSGSGGGSPLPTLPGPGTSSTPLPSSTNWAAGETFNYNDLPAAMKSQMVQVQIEESGYYSFNGPKAVAITSSGLGYVRRMLAPATQAQAERAALQACNAISGNQPCGLIAKGNQWAVSRANLNNVFTTTLTVPSSVTTSIPFLADSDASQAATSYNTSASPKAMAISLDGMYVYIAQSSTDPIANLDEAKRLAMERCEMVAGSTPCTLYAQDGAVVFSPGALNRATSIDYGRTTIQTNMPGVKQIHYTTYISGNYLKNGGVENGAIWINALGSAGIRYGTLTNDTLARDTCASFATASAPCFRYAVNNVIQPLAPNLASFKYYGQNAHCKVMPRATCAMHKALGCPAGGQYYVLQAGAVTLMTCN